MSTYLVTGAAGFIASRVCELLFEAGHTVVGVDNLNDYYDVRLKLYRLGRLLGADQKPETGNLKPEGSESDLGQTGLPSISGLRSQVSGLTRGRFTFHHLDIEDLPALERVFVGRNFAAVFNLAARAGVRASLENPEIYRTTNILGEENILKCQVKFGVKKHVLASSSSVYAGCPMPFVETATLGQMQSPYAETKRAAELLAKEYHEQHGLDVTVLRYFTVFGPAGRPDMAPLRFIKWIDEGTPITLYGDGSQARDFTYIDDIARGTVLAGRLFGGRLKPETGNLKPEAGRRLGGDGEAKLKAELSETKSGSDSPPSAFSFQPSAFSGGLPPTYEVINLGGGNNPLSITAMIGIIEEALYDRGRRAEDGGPIKAKISGQPASTADMDKTWADISNAGRLLGWKPQISPAGGFEKTVDWYLANRNWLSEIRI